MSSSSGRNQNRSDLLESTSEPHPSVQALGSSALHGPPKEQHIVIVLGVGPGLGISIARIFAQQGYAVAILSRNKSRLDNWAKELDQTIRTVNKGKESTSQSLAFSCDVLSNESIKKAIADIQAAWPDKKIGTAVYNASVRKRGPFLEQRPDQIQQGVQASIFAGITFMQSIIGSMMERNQGQGGNVLITGATSSTRGREGFAGFAASKSGLRAICQSVAREFGPKGIHVAHIIVDGLIESQEAMEYIGLQKGHRFPNGSVSELDKSAFWRLFSNPSVMKALRPEEMCKTWLFLASQHQSAWTFEMDLRPAKEHF